MREMENFCVGCPQGCINCGRKNDVLVITCDWCGEDIEYECDYDNEIIKGVNTINEQDICDDCYAKYENGELDENGNEVEEE